MFVPSESRMELNEFTYGTMDTNSAILTLFSMTASALLLNSNCGIRGARQAKLAAGDGQAREDGDATPARLPRAQSGCVPLRTRSKELSQILSPIKRTYSP